MFRKGFASFVVAAAATAVLWTGSASAQVRTAALENGVPALTAATNENRIALVIGNSAYKNNKPLNNPANDAQAVSQLLNTAGFEVVMAFDLNRDVMKQTVAEFAARINEKGPNTVAMVYYAGHGLQVDGENYLVPVDAKFESETDLVENGVKLADVMSALEAVPSKARIVILDACRNNPFTASGDAGGKGLAIVDAPAGSIVAYSTAPGTEAFDGLGRHSPYAAAFMRTVKQPNMPIEQVFKKVRVLVHESTDSKQTPWESSSLTSDFVFFTNAVNGGGAAPVPAQAPVKLALADLGSRPVNVAYEAVVAEDSIEYYEEFVRLYPTDPLCDRIRRLLSRRQQMIAWQNVTHRNSPDAYASFVSRFSDSDLVRAARRLQERPRLVNIAFPKRDEGRFGDGRFGNGGIKIGNLGNNRPIIDFPRGNGGRPVIGFPRNSNGGRPVVNPQVGNGGNNGGRPVIGFPQNGQNGSRPFPNGNTGINGSGQPNANNSGGRVIPFPNGNTGINGSGRPNANNSGNRVIPFPQNGNRPGQVAKLPQNGNLGINPSAGRPITNRQQIGNQGINPNAGRPIFNRPQIGNQRISPNIGRATILPRPSFQPRVASGGNFGGSNRFVSNGGGGGGRFGGGFGGRR
ncbi:caspase family protein [Pseudorhodoplanes sinuspersici]|nr:caspase family protein [Pseudorhodoplanes sinuspersici]RKE72733.1 caspase domain-containing protein [Pseudorhodoplanes sinuspersici]